MQAARYAHAWLARTGAFILLGLALAGISSGASAEDVGVTMQTTLSPAYQGTAPLTPPIVSKLKNVAINSDDPAAIAAGLRRLKNGDVLVLAVHSSPKVFAVGQKLHPWSEFWKTFGIAEPPRLSAIIIGGCMFEEVGKDKFTPITPAQVRELRSHLNAELIYTPRGAIPFVLALANTDGILGSLVADKKLKDIDLGGKWYQNVSVRWIIQNRWSTVSLTNLRRVAANSRAYEAGADAARGRPNPDNVAKRFDGDPTYKLGYDHASVAPDKTRAEEEELRKRIMEQ